MEPFKEVKDAQEFIARTAYEHFRRTGQWPITREFDLEYDNLLEPLGGLEVLCRQMGPDTIYCGSVGSEHDRVVLRLEGLAELDEAVEDLQHVLAGLRLCAKRYRDAKGRDNPRIGVDDLRAELGLDESTAQRAFVLLQTASWISTSGGGTSIVLGHFASKLGDVRTMGEYFARVDAELRRREALSPTAIPATRPPKLPGSPPTSAQPLGRLFLSHAADDATFANVLTDKLRASKASLKIFVASRPGDISSGEEWLARIGKELQEADAYVVLLTPTSVKRPWIWFESGAAWMTGRGLIPVTAGGLVKGDVPLPLGAYQALALESPDDVIQLGRALGVNIENPDAFCRLVGEISQLRQETLAQSADSRPLNPRVNHVEAGGAIPEPTEEPDDTEQKILNLWAKGPASLSLEIGHVAGALQVSEQRAQFYLDQLDKKRYLHAMYAMGRPPRYLIDHRGREFLVRKGLT